MVWIVIGFINLVLLLWFIGIMNDIKKFLVKIYFLLVDITEHYEIPSQRELAKQRKNQEAEEEKEVSKNRKIIIESQLRKFDDQLP